METLTKSHKGRIAIRLIKTTADALALRGYYRPSGKSGQTLAEGLRLLSPEIYGTMNDHRIIELKGLEYVIERLPKGIEECNRIILTAQEELEETSFEKIIPPKRRRTSYRVSEKEICFVITRGLSEIYDILTHLTFLDIEAKKIRNQIRDNRGQITREWQELENVIKSANKLKGGDLDLALWNLSIILGRTYHETRDTYRFLEEHRKIVNSERGIFQIIYSLGKRVEEEELSKNNILIIYFTPTLKEMIGHQKYGEKWAKTIKEKICVLGLKDRPIHIISANMHSVVNTLYAYSANKKSAAGKVSQNLYSFFQEIKDQHAEIKEHAQKNGLYELPDNSGAHIDCQLIDTAMLENIDFHPQLKIDKKKIKADKPVILVMDYAFGIQAYEVMDELLYPFEKRGKIINFNIQSISIMGKAGTLPGKKGDIMLANAHVLEGTPHNYIVTNFLTKKDFDASATVYKGPIVTVLGTSLQNRDVLQKFQTTSWKAVGLEMEGGHYQRAINAAIIRGHISNNVKVSYAYYASDNPLISGQTLASGSMGEEGIKPTYMITKAILEKILNLAVTGKSRKKSFKTCI